MWFLWWFPYKLGHTVGYDKGMSDGWLRGWDEGRKFEGSRAHWTNILTSAEAKKD